MHGTRHIQLTAEMGNLGQILSLASGWAGEIGLSPERTNDIQVVLEEAFVNICRYAYPEGAGPVEVNCSLEGGRAVIEITDSGVPFDMTARALPDVTPEIHERKIGGLGCLLIRKLADQVVYRRRDGKNILRMQGL